MSSLHVLIVPIRSLLHLPSKQEEEPKTFWVCARQTKDIFSAVCHNSQRIEVEKTSIASAGIVLVFIFAGLHRPVMSKSKKYVFEHIEPRRT